MVAHGAVGIVGGIAAKKLLGTGGLVVFVVGSALVIVFHRALDAPVAKAMAAAGLQL